MNNELQKIEELEATIAKAQQQIEELKKPKIERFKPEYRDRYDVVLEDGRRVTLLYMGDSFDADAYNFFNCYETKELAEKAIPLMRRSNAIIMAKLLVDPDFEPDWDDKYQEKCSAYYSYSLLKWCPSYNYIINDSVASVSTQEKAEQMCDLLTDWGVR